MLNVLQIPPHHIAHQLAHTDTKLLLTLYGHPEESVSREAIKEGYRKQSGGNVTHLRQVARDGN
jgi:hypothetical protein